MQIVTIFLLSHSSVYQADLQTIVPAISSSNRRLAAVHAFKENDMNTAGYVTSWGGLVLSIITIIIIAVSMISITSDISRYCVTGDHMNCELFWHIIFFTETGFKE